MYAKGKSKKEFSTRRLHCSVCISHLKPWSQAIRECVGSREILDSSGIRHSRPWQGCVLWDLVWDPLWVWKRKGETFFILCCVFMGNDFSRPLAETQRFICSKFCHMQRNSVFQMNYWRVECAQRKSWGFKHLILCETWLRCCSAPCPSGWFCALFEWLDWLHVELSKPLNVSWRSKTVKALVVFSHWILLKTLLHIVTITDNNRGRCPPLAKHNPLRLVSLIYKSNPFPD